jgi:hypothetical protein
VDIETGQLEPFVGSLAVWSARDKARLSESLSFETNDLDIKSFMGGTYIRCCCCCLSDIWLLLLLLLLV